MHSPMTGCVIYTLLLPAILTCASGCGSTAASPRSSDHSSTTQASFTMPAANPGCRSSREFRELWSTRNADPNTGDYPIGPGDLLRISVVGIDQLEKREVRVSGDGTITFPFAGTLQVVRMTDEGLEHDLTRRL